LPDPAKEWFLYSPSFCQKKYSSDSAKQHLVSTPPESEYTSKFSGSKILAKILLQ